MKTGFSEAEVRTALLRITASEPFRNAPQLVSFLTFVVERKLAGQAPAIKGYTIATQALGRPEDFDPQIDPIVRVEAGRLRRALETYYRGQGRSDPVRISIPRGAYVPKFDEALSGSTEASAAAGEPPAGESQGAPAPRPRAQGAWLLAALVMLALGMAGIAWVLSAMQGGGARQVADGTRSNSSDGRIVLCVTRIELNGVPSEAFSPEVMRSMVIDGLARFNELAVIDLSGDQRAPNADRYVLNLRATAGSDAVVVVARLTHAKSGRIVWTRSFDSSQSSPGVSPETDIARRIAAVVAQPYGALFADLRARSDLDGSVRCFIQTFDYQSNPTAALHGELRDCLEAILAARPRDTVVLAKLTQLYLDEYRVGYNSRPAALDRALDVARKAVAAAPDSPRANQALMSALFLRGEVEEALRLGKQALAFNPHDTDFMAGLGARLVQAGRYKEGSDLIRKAAETNPADPPWYNFFLFLAAYMQNDVPSARAAASRIPATDYVLGLVAKIAVAADDRQPEQAQELVARMISVQPEYATDPARALARRNFAPEIQSRLLDALRRGGLPS